ncbi:TPA: hypothetical protein ACTYPY_005646 [Klebsiella pneumoniae]|uniref:hypothetical protein n=1 Tax=Klebsiella pneumoniae complex TaxID=3390273 RepID=UPI0006666BFA|nr:hypothetical protein [Klebsiella pneumoniae]HBW1966952.1 hypothetical protein [Klebsiella quasipneumoniae subsp. similipneumoniae]HCM7452505.1 hypothetical protein [Klebsiella quasipneumoniae]EKJ7310571.1 hypothetical protein [Klebsiella pneumoniae]EKW0387943.1 hypothetical protein [Klebsiella pneumoniae]MBE0214529.1 hypothetical protein [Klebsiella pneumoniae]
MIYHYTDLNAAKSITENAQIWLTDYRFLNDKEEFTNGHEVLLDALNEYNDYSGKYPQKFIDDIGKAVEFIRDRGSNEFTHNNIFVSSFSRTPDLLNQWRSYGMYCIELDEVFFRDDEVVVLDCHYLQDEGDALDYAILLIDDHILPNLMNVWKKNKALLSLELSSLIDIYALSFKHQAFFDENEIRFVISCSPDDDRINFRTRGNLLIPYIPLAFEPQLLKSITIGPIDNQELACASLAMFLEKISRKVRQEQDDIEYCLVVENSELPYRNI